ncbi:hypothetical protein [Streptomyces sp. NBC_01794]|nr:hypothetical protein OIE54_00815 [Streptomyces sp. NBC_01794]
MGTALTFVGASMILAALSVPDEQKCNRGRSAARRLGARSQDMPGHADA